MGLLDRQKDIYIDRQLCSKQAFQIEGLVDRQSIRQIYSCEVNKHYRQKDWQIDRVLDRQKINRQIDSCVVNKHYRWD